MKNENEIIMCPSDEKEFAWHSYKCVIDKLLELPMSGFATHYESDNLNHDVIILYY